MTVVGATESGSWWSRQSQKDKVAILAFGVSLVVSTVLVLVGLLVPDSTLNLGARFALLTSNIVAMVAALQFAMSRFFDDQKDQLDGLGTKLDDVNLRISRTLEEMESVTGLGEAYVKIFQQEERIKNQHQNTLDAFLRRLSNCIDDKRSGALDLMDYYGVLENLAVQIEGDMSAEKEKASSQFNYSGEIWALTFLLDDEWDDASIHEVKWFQTLKRLDQEGIPTRRLWAFDKKMMALLKKDPIEEDARELVRRLALYCADNTEYPHTKSFALPKETILDEHVRLFGKGFFAAALSSGDLHLIRGVCFDNLLSQNALGGEVDFDEMRIREIRFQWERYLALAAPLRQYVEGIASPSALAFMKSTWSANSD